MKSYLKSIAVSRLLKTLALLRHCVVLTGAYSIEIVRSWHQSIDVGNFVFLVEFQDELSISVMINRATLYNKWELSLLKITNRHQLSYAEFEKHG